ncbi:MAG TPA: FAD-dependent oxidoreductase, partial [Acidimicrobiales bacterium]
EGGERRFAVRTVAVHGDTDGAVDSIAIEHVDGGSGGEAGEVEHVRADLVVLAMGFVGPERAVGDSLGTRYTTSGTIEVDANFATMAPGVFACGDAARGQSLVVWAIAEGRSAARAVDAWLMGDSTLDAPVRSTDRALA